MANDENLKKGEATRFRAGEEQARKAAEAGKKSGESRRRKKAMRENMKMLLSLGIPEDSKIYQKLLNDGVSEDDMVYQTAVNYAMMGKAISGNVRAAEYVRDTAGENFESAEKIKLAKAELKLKRAQFEYLKAKAEAEAAGASDGDDADDGFIKALEGKIDNEDWGEDDGGENEEQ